MIVPSILHYTEPGDLVLDGFASSGMTGVAAQWYGTAPESYRKTLEARWTAESFGKPKWGAPACAPERLVSSRQRHLPPTTLYPSMSMPSPRLAVPCSTRWRKSSVGSTRPGTSTGRPRDGSTTLSGARRSPARANEVTFLEKGRGSGKVRDGIACPTCDTTLDKGKLERALRSDMDAVTGRLRKRIAYRQVLIQYKADGRTLTKALDACDQDIIRRIEDAPPPGEVSTERLPVESMYYGSRLASKGITRIHHFFFPRAAHALAAMWRRADAHPNSRIHRMLFSR